MKIRHAQRLLRLMRRNKTLTAPYSIVSEEGPLVTGLPMGAAAGSHNEYEITVHLAPLRGAQYQGIGEPHGLRVPRLAPYHLWEQEEYVYRLEMRDHVRRALAELPTTIPIPRLGEYRDGRQVDSAIASDLAPYAEDFGGVEKPVLNEKDNLGNWYLLYEDGRMLLGLKDELPGRCQVQLIGRRTDGIYACKRARWNNNCWHIPRYPLLKAKLFGIRMCFFSLADGNRKVHRGWVHPKVLTRPMRFHHSTGYEWQVRLLPADLCDTEEEALKIWHALEKRLKK